MSTPAPPTQRNVARHPSSAESKPPNKMPSAMPIGMPNEYTASARPRCSGGK